MTYSIFVWWSLPSNFTRVTKKLLKCAPLPPPPPKKTKDLFNNLRFNYIKVFTVGVESFFRPFEPRPEERTKHNFWKEPQRRPCTMINFPSSPKVPFSVCFLSVLRTEENSWWLDDQVRVEEEMVEKPLMYRETFSTASQEWH